MARHLDSEPPLFAMRNRQNLAVLLPKFQIGDATKTSANLTITLSFVV
jgi:hypothetical protein